MEWHSQNRVPLKTCGSGLVRECSGTDDRDVSKVLASSRTSPLPQFFVTAEIRRKGVDQDLINASTSFT